MSRLPALGRRGEGWVVIQVVLLVVVALAGTTGPVLEELPRLLAAAAGLVLVIAGGWLAFRGIVDLRDALTPLPHPKDDAELVDRGAYARARHPIYGGLVIAAAGYALITASPVALLGAAVLLAFFRLKSSREEAWLRDRYAGYAAYAARTKRMIPGIY